MVPLGNWRDATIEKKSVVAVHARVASNNTEPVTITNYCSRAYTPVEHSGQESSADVFLLGERWQQDEITKKERGLDCSSA